MAFGLFEERYKYGFLGHGPMGPWAHGPGPGPGPMGPGPRARPLGPLWPCIFTRNADVLHKKGMYFRSMDEAAQRGFFCCKIALSENVKCHFGVFSDFSTFC